jgi:hypothetical protein
MGQMKNMFYLEENSSKLCVEGAIGNLMNMLHCSKDGMELFRELATSDLPSIMKSLNELNVPQKVFKLGLEIDSIEKCLWILHKKIIFATTTTVKVNRFRSWKPTLGVLLEIKFPMLILVESKLATYHHVIVVWEQRVIDYETMFTLTEESLRQMCGVNTTFTKISSGCGIFPSKQIRQKSDNGCVIDWGSTEYYKPGSAEREYFSFKK